MDFYTIAGIIIMVLVIAAAIVAMRKYQKDRVKEGYKYGKFYRLGQHTGAFVGNYHMNKMGVFDDDSGNRVETDAEMYLFTDSDSREKE